MLVAGGFVLALLVLTWALGLAERAFEPWGDSPRALSAGVAAGLLGLGTALVSLAMGASRVRIQIWRFPNWLEPLVYGLSCIAVAVPLAVGASNSREASSIGEGGPPVALLVLGGIALVTALACLMRRRISLGLLASVVLGVALMAFALAIPR